MPLQHFFVANRSLGSRPIHPEEIVNDVIHPTTSIAWFCPKCGEVWGRLHVDTADYSQCWQRPCLSHGDGRLSEDWVPWHRAYFKPDWPPAAIAYEFAAQLKYHEKGLS